MSSIKPIFLHGHAGPGPWKIAILLEELNIPYTNKVYATPELKQPAFLSINRNGKAPVIEDPNTHLVLNESGAIMDYLVEQYDTENRISFKTMAEKYHMKQWLQFQTTTQEPPVHDVFRWAFLKPNPAARAFSIEEFRRVLQVLNDELAEKEWLVGDKCSAADLSYVPFHSRVEFILKDDKPNMEVEFPHVDAWYKRMLERGSVQKVLAEHTKVLKSGNVPGRK